MNKNGLIGMIVIAGVLLVVGFFWFTHQAGLKNGLKNETIGEKLGEYLEEEIKCVPASCCHPTACVLESEAPNCTNIMCTMVCSGPLDCGAGRCEYIDGECEVVKNE